MSKNEEIRYHMEIEPPVYSILNKINSDIGAFGITDDEFLRAVSTWALERVQEYDSPPTWLWTVGDKPVLLEE